jgi:hypothetical protein
MNLFFKLRNLSAVVNKFLFAMSTATGFQGTGGPKENVLQNLFCFEM